MDQRFDWAKWEAAQRAAVEMLEGGPQMLAYFGFTPSFHDAEILQLDLNRDRPSIISVQTWKADPGEPSQVEITIGEIIDLQLDGFSIQNVVGDISFRVPAPVREARKNLYTPSDRPAEEVEIGLGPCYGVEGFIRCLDVSFAVRPSLPRRLRKSRFP